jgi:hypothetical protein
MKTKFEIMRANRVARPASAALLLPLVPIVPIVPTMTIDGVEYEEADDLNGNCSGCAFDGKKASCFDACTSARGAFGGQCGQRDVVYIKAA